MASLAFRAALLSTSLCVGLSAQDLIGVGWAGQVVRIDSQTAT